MVTRQTFLKKTVLLLCLLATLLFQTRPAVSLSIKEERELGEKLMFQVRRAFPLLEEPDLSEYITSLGNEVVAVAGTHYFSFHFYIINSDQFNAFAAPSGLIFFYSGLISQMESENELVAVMAHEVAHVAKRHIASGQKEGSYSNAAALALALLGVAIGGDAAPALIAGAMATGQTVNLHYSRLHEQEADSLAYEWLRKMKRDPQAEVRMLGTMRRIARYRSEKLPQYLLTHPNPEERMGVVESFLESDGIPDDIREIDEFNFLRFKYRILVSSEKPELLRNYFANRFTRTDSTSRAMAQFGMAQLARKELNFRRAQQLIDEVIAVFPDKNILKVDKGVILTEAGDWEQALALLDEAHRHDPADLYALWSLGRLLKRMGRDDEARHLFEELERGLPHFPQLLFALGELEARRGNRGIADGYLAASQLYGGQIKAAEASLRRALSDNSLPSAWKRRCIKMEERIRRLKR